MKKSLKKGMSLIVLVITIVVMIILAGVVVIGLANNNPIDSAIEAVFKSDVGNFKSELVTTLANKFSKDPQISKDDINASTPEEIKEYIPSFKDDYDGKLEIINGEITFVGNDDNERDWSKEVKIPVGIKRFLKTIKTNGTEYSVNITTVSDGYVLSGCTNATNLATNKGQYDFFFIKYDKQGNEIWKRMVGGNDNENMLNSVISDGDNIVFVGAFYSNDGAFLRTSNYDAIIGKLDKDGNIVWVKQFGGNQFDSFQDVLKVSDGYIAVGDMQSTNISGLHNNGVADSIAVKYDFNGNVVYKKSNGGEGYDCLYSLIEVNGKYVGAVQVCVSFNGMAESLRYCNVTMLFDENMNPLQVMDMNYFTDNDGRNVLFKVSDGYILVDDLQRTNPDFTLENGHGTFIKKFNNNNELVWKKLFGGNDTEGEIFSMQEVSDGYVFAAFTNGTNLGFTNKGNADGVLFKLDKDGNQKWIKNYGGSQDDYIFTVNSLENGFVCAGRSHSNDNNFTNDGGNDPFIMQVNAKGEM